MEDALYAQLLSMGFDISLIERYRLVMASSDTPRDLTAATEWLLEHAARQPGQATPTSAHVEDVQQPMSSTKDLSSSSAEGSGPLHSRYAMSERQARDKQRYQSKEREEVVRKARETKAAEQKAKQLIKQQIADDRKARSLRGEHGPVEVAVVKEGAGAIAAPVGSTSDTCRVQVRLPDGKSLRYTLQSSTTLREVSKAVMADAPNLPAVLQFVQPFPPHEYTPDECQRTLKALGLCPSASLVVHLPKHSAPEHDQPMDTSHSQDTSHSPSSVNPTGERTGEVGLSIEEAESAEQPHPPEDEAENMDVEGLDVRQPPPPPLADVARRHVRFDMPVWNPLLVAQGGGHRLGGTLQPTHRSGEGSHDAALEATLRRIQVAPPPSGVQVHKVWPSVQTLENLCVKYLLGMSGAGGLPTSCGSLPPRLVQLIITRLAEAKQLNGKTLLALHKW
eukprot:Em0004g1680a